MGNVYMVDVVGGHAAIKIVPGGENDLASRSRGIQEHTYVMLHAACCLPSLCCCCLLLLLVKCEVQVERVR